MEQNMGHRQQLVQQYKQDAMPLLRYLPWLEQHAGQKASSVYDSSENNPSDGRSLAFPVYDATLMQFVKEAGKSPFMDRNYRYVYTRGRIQSPEDERRIIEKAGIEEWNLLCGILSRYVLGGRTKGMLWSQAVSERIFYLILKQMKSIIEFWDRPFDVRE